jgi:hypothetical protein
VHNGPVRDSWSDEILIAGLGSVGRRHLSNLQTLGWKHIRLYALGSACGSLAAVGRWPTHTRQCGWRRTSYSAALAGTTRYANSLIACAVICRRWQKISSSSRSGA